MTERGWLCPSCGRGVAPSEKTCDHGGGFAYPSPSTHFMIAPHSGTDCGCPPFATCGNVACPRMSKTTFGTVHGERSAS